MASALVPATLRSGTEEGASSAEVSLTNTLHNAVSKVAGRGLAQARAALSGGGGQDAGGAGGQSAANHAGPAGDLSGFTEEDLTAGAGHDQYVISGDHSETIGALGVTAAVGSLLTNVTANMTQTVGAAHVELILGDRAESTEGMKTESSLGLIVLSKGDESETVHAMRSAMIGGARFEQVDGNREVSSDAMVSLVGAMHKIEAETKLTFSCGASSIVVDNSGITLTSPMIDFMGASITLEKDVNDG
jgi:type VI secretion system secreted protein VgrG